jgi:hypothetical protein
MDFLAVLLAIALFLSLLWGTWKIVSQAGYSGVWGLLYVIPIVNIVVFFVFAFSKWPAIRRLEDRLSSEQDATRELTWKLDKLEKASSSQSHDERNSPKYEEAAFESVATELSTDSVHNGLWLKAEVLAAGDREKQRLEYVKLRVAALMSTQTVDMSSSNKEAQSQAPHTTLYGVCKRCKSTINLRSSTCTNCNEPISV